MTDLVFDRKDVFTVLNAEDAPKVEGYFGNTLQELNYAIDNQEKRTLMFVYGLDVNPFCVDEDCYALFLPVNKVKKIEKKWRPYTLEEFLDKFPIGTQIKFRKKKELQIVVHGCGVLTGYSCNTNQVSEEDCIFVYLGVHAYSLEVLCETYEWQDKNSNWCPFGVEE